MTNSPASEPRPERAVAPWTVAIWAIAAGVISLVFYWMTAYRSLAWWNQDYPLSAVTLGIPAPPGSLLLTLLGWVAVHFPFGASRIFTLNVFSGVMAAATVSILVAVAVSMYRNSEMRMGGVLLVGTGNAVAIGAAVGALTLAFSITMWTYAVRFTPYVLTAVFTSLILLAMMKWWRRADTRTAALWMMIVALLFGLDFSVHRTNLLMLPGLFFVVLLRRPRTLISAKHWGLGLAGFGAGLSAQLLMIPMAAAKPLLNIGNPSSWQSFYDYVSLKQMGGGFLINLYPRKAPLIMYQLHDYLKAFADNFLSIHGWAGVLGVLPFLLGLFGFIILWRRSWKLGAALTILFLLTSLGAVAYFNIPENFFRSFDRHYLPSFVIFSGFIAYGAAAIVSAAAYEGAGVQPIIAGLIVLLAPGYLAYHNYAGADRSREYFAYDYATNILATLPENSIVVTSGDNDTFTLLYLQGAENMRRDVTVVNSSLLNTVWFTEELMETTTLPLFSLKPEELWQLKVKPWKDTVLTFAAPTDLSGYALPDGYQPTDSVAIEVQPTIQGKFLMVSDQLMIDLIRTNNWTRPIYFTYPYSWLQPHLRPEGMAYRLLPVDSAAVNRDILRQNLLDKYVYRGYDDPSLAMEFATRNNGMTLVMAFAALAMEDMRVGDSAMCSETMDYAFRVIPPDRIQLPDQLRQRLGWICSPPAIDSTLQEEQAATE